MAEPLSSTERIAEGLATFLCCGEVTAVFHAEGRMPPPQMAFVVRFPRLSLTLEGTDEMEVEQAGARRLLTPRGGEAVFVPPDAWNRPTWTRRVKVLHLLFGHRLIGVSLVEHAGRGGEPSRAWKTSLPRANSGPLGDLLKAFVTLAAQPSERAPADRLLATALLHLVLALFHNRARQGGRKGRHTFERVCLYVQENFQRDLTRASVAAQFRLNPNHLSRLFQREGLMRYTDYLAWVRIDRAKYLLKHYEMTLDELSSACGFHDIAYFCRVFKQRTSQTPTAYRLSAWTRAAPSASQTALVL